MKVLIVDDEEDVRSLLADLVEMITQQPAFSAPSASAALEHLRSQTNSYDLILSDIRMPEMNGIEFAGIVIKEFPAIQIALMTGYADISDKGCSQMGVVRLFRKPFDYDDLETFILGLKK